MSETRILTCDLCKKEIDTKKSYVDATTYGAHFHIGCITADMYKILVALSLDEITVRASDGDTSKFVYDYTYKRKFLESS